MEIRKTERWLKIITFSDTYNDKFGLQESRIEDCIWFWTKNSESLHLSQEIIKELLPHLEKFVETWEL